MTTDGELLHYEDFSVGLSGQAGPFIFTRELILAYAAEWDPQPFHLDEAAAEASVLGGLCASGWQLCAAMNRLMVDGYANRAAGMGSFGIREMKWLKPVYVGDRIMLEWQVMDWRVSASRPGMGIITMLWRARDQAGTLKGEMTGTNLFQVRAAAEDRS